MFKFMITTSTNVFFLGNFFVAYTVQSTVSTIVEYCTPLEWVYTNTVGHKALLALASHQWYTIQQFRGRTRARSAKSK
jgi:hypothetical protein